MKKNKSIRIIILSVVIGFLILSCNLLNIEYTWTFENQSSYVVNIFSTNFNPSEFTLVAGASRSFTNSNSTVSIQYAPVNTVDVSTNTTLKGGTFTFRNRFFF